MKNYPDEKNRPDFYRPAWMEVNLGNLRANYRNVKKLVGPECMVMGVVKNNAYSLGLVPVSLALFEEGCDFLAVATIDEAMEIRAVLPDISILVMAPTTPESIGVAAENNISCACGDRAFACALARASTEFGKKVRIHVKVDTGLSRNGFFPEETVPSILEMRSAGVVLEGIFTHLAVGGEENQDYTRWQYSRFEALLRELDRIGVTFACRHVCNSSATVNFPDMRLDAVRPGGLLYGYPESVTELPFDLLPTVSVKTRLAVVRRLPPRTPVSYGLTYVTRGEIPVGLLSIGYGDGFVRNLPKPEVLVRGRRTPVIGRICMDQAVVDLSRVPDAQPGDEVVVLGRQDDEEIPLREWTEKMETVPGQVLSYFTSRLPRVYV